MALLAGGGEDGAGAPEGSSEPLPRPSLDPQALTGRAQGIAVHAPAGWTTSSEHGVMALSSPDGAVKVSITSVATPASPKVVLADATAAIRGNYDEVAPVAGSTGGLVGKRIGGLPASSAVLSARQDDAELRVLVSAARGEAHTYLVEVFSASDAPAARLAEAQLALRTLRLTG